MHNQHACVYGFFQKTNYFVPYPFYIGIYIITYILDIYCWIPVATSENTVCDHSLCAQFAYNWPTSLSLWAPHKWSADEEADSDKQHDDLRLQFDQYSPSPNTTTKCVVVGAQQQPAFSTNAVVSPFNGAMHVSSVPFSGRRVHTQHTHTHTHACMHLQCVKYTIFPLASLSLSLSLSAECLAEHHAISAMGGTFKYFPEW